MGSGRLLEMQQITAPWEQGEKDPAGRGRASVDSDQQDLNLRQGPQRLAERGCGPRRVVACGGGGPHPGASIASEFPGAADVALGDPALRTADTEERKDKESQQERWWGR